MIKLLIADDEYLVRKLFKLELAKYDDIEIISEANDGEEVMNALSVSTPDVLLLDINMPKVSGIEVLKMIQKKPLYVNTIVISVNENEDVIQQVIEAGVLGFLSKNEEWDEVYTAIKTVAGGNFYYTKKINSILLRIVRQKVQQGDPEFSERELLIIGYLTEGLNSSQIAEELFCSRQTVDRIRQELIHRVGARNTSGLVSYAIRQKLGK